ncbi:hypothetical protein SCHPADRAFT_1003402 [Schizopora paradoxa]|uniref:Uncharacterized protein n=1 Tax=Schizopora paradoxa TaxID=27342 RepID=A0A0H2QXJ8_9AGAM|nr:hypothetical protein SCHPADRAFT_1003402 [Schizopora paradoxa]
MWYGAVRMALGVRLEEVRRMTTASEETAMARRGTMPMPTNTALTTAISSSTQPSLAGRRSIPSTCVDEYELLLNARKSGALPLSFCTVEVWRVLHGDATRTNSSTLWAVGCDADVARGTSIRPYNVWEGLVMCSLWTWCSADEEMWRRATWSENDDDGEAQHHHNSRTTHHRHLQLAGRRSIPSTYIGDISCVRSSELSKFESIRLPAFDDTSRLRLGRTWLRVGDEGGAKLFEAPTHHLQHTSTDTDANPARGTSIRTVDVLEATGTSMDGGLWKKNGGGRCVKDFDLHSSMRISARERSSCALDTYRCRVWTHPALRSCLYAAQRATPTTLLHTQRRNAISSNSYNTLRLVLSTSSVSSTHT